MPSPPNLWWGERKRVIKGNRGPYSGYQTTNFRYKYRNDGRRKEEVKVIIGLYQHGVRGIRRNNQRGKIVVGTRPGHANKWEKQRSVLGWGCRGGPKTGLTVAVGEPGGKEKKRLRV